ncbi:hypothetical protein, partial [Youhaiella tibetensis]|uniref:hypothetical protein n=1 Tax=Paradevosia tibetensis TaxID=1447062 RepID=UPI001AEEF97F
SARTSPSTFLFLPSSRCQRADPECSRRRPTSSKATAFTVPEGTRIYFRFEPAATLPCQNFVTHQSVGVINSLASFVLNRRFRSGQCFVRRRVSQRRLSDVGVIWATRFAVNGHFAKNEKIRHLDLWKVVFAF